MANKTGFCPLAQEDNAYYSHLLGITVDWIIIFIGLPGIITAIYVLQRLVKVDHEAPVFLINLLVSDLFQIAITVVFSLSRFFDQTAPVSVAARCISRAIVRLGITASLGFMVCISVERYLTVAYPIWYRNHRTVKCYIVMSLCVWVISALYALLDFILVQDLQESQEVFSVILLTPALPLIVFWVLTHKALKHCRSIQRDESRRIMGTLGLVLGIYMVLFLPFCIRNLYYILASVNKQHTSHDPSLVVTMALTYLSPLADPFLYIFMRRDITNIIGISLCFGRLFRRARSEEESRQTTHI